MYDMCCWVVVLCRRIDDVLLLLLLFAVGVIGDDANFPPHVVIIDLTSNKIIRARSGQKISMVHHTYITRTVYAQRITAHTRLDTTRRTLV